MKKNHVGLELYAKPRVRTTGPLRLRFEFGTENIIKTTVCRAHRRIVAPGVPSVCCVRVQGMGQRIPGSRQ